MIRGRLYGVSRGIKEIASRIPRSEQEKVMWDLRFAGGGGRDDFLPWNFQGM